MPMKDLMELNVRLNTEYVALTFRHCYILSNFVHAIAQSGENIYYIRGIGTLPLNKDR